MDYIGKIMAEYYKIAHMGSFISYFFIVGTLILTGGWAFLFNLFTGQILTAFLTFLGVVILILILGFFILQIHAAIQFKEGVVEKNAAKMKIFHLLRLIEMILAIIGLVLVLLIVIIVALFDSEDAFEKSSASLPNAFTNQQFNSGPFELIMGFAVLYMKSLLVSVFLVIVLFCSFTFFVTREMMSKCERFENNGCHQATKEFHEFNDIGESRA